MSGSTKTGLLPRFSPAATQAAVDASTDTYPADYITNIIIEISGYLINLAEHTDLLGRAGNDPYSPNLRTLHSRLHNGQFNPCPIRSHANEHARIKANLDQRTTKNAAHRPLEDFEDLYYAVLARMQDIHHILNARLGSGFSTITDLVHTDGPSIADLHISLTQYWDVLNHTAFVKAIDSAVRRSRVKYLHQEIIAQVHNDEITRADAEELLSDLYDPSEYDSIQGLAWVSGWAPSMVAAWLEEKYRIVLNIEKEDAERTSRMDRKRARMGKKVTQPQHELRSKKAGKKVIDEVQTAGGENQMAVQNDQYAQKQSKKGHGNTQEELDYALEWQVKTQRVSEYSRYLRSMASHDAKYVVASTACNNDMRISGFGGPVHHIDNEDIDMVGTGF